MKSRVVEICISFILLHLFAVVAGAALLTGILLTPLFVLAIGAFAVREIFVWRKTVGRRVRRRFIELQPAKGGIIRHFPIQSPAKNVA